MPLHLIFYYRTKPSSFADRRWLTNSTFRKKIITATPQKRFGKPQDLLGTLLFLADDTYSAFVTGVTIPVDGGFMAYAGV